MTPYLTKHKRQTTAFFAVFLMLTATLTSITQSAEAAAPLLDIAYNIGGNIWIQRADGTKTQLTSNTNASSIEYIPVVSPDGLQIAFAAKVPNSTRDDAIWVMGIDGSNPHQVTSLSTPITASSIFTDRDPRWSPDGTRISFERDVETFDTAGNLLSGISDIVVKGVPTGSESTVTSSDHSASGPAAWSPDGSRLAYWKTNTAGFSIIGADGSGEHPLSLLTPRYPSDPAWAPDGNTIYFDTDDPSVSGIMYFTSSDQFASALNAPAKNLTADVSDFEPHFTPDGKSVGFRRGGVIEIVSLVDGTLSQQPPTGVTGFSFIPAPPSGPPGATASYVALGDSYSAGEGNAPFYPDSASPSTWDACHRSYVAYGPLLDKDVNLGSMLFKACSGSVTQDFFAKNYNGNGERDQTSWLSDQTKTVTLTVGGNDVGFPNVLDHCVSGFRPDNTYIDGTGCANIKTGQHDIDNRLKALAGKKSDTFIVGPPIHSELSVLERINQKARNAHIYIAGYPQLFGNDPNNYVSFTGRDAFFHGHAQGQRRCLLGATQGQTIRGKLYGSVLYYVDFKDAQWMNNEATLLNDVIQVAVNKAKAEGIPVTYVAPQFDGHGLCDTHPSWLYGLEFASPTTQSPGSFHPTVAGQRYGYEEAFKKAMS